MEKSAQLLVRPDVRVSNFENNIDRLADQIAELALIMKKTQYGSSQAQKDSDGDKVCSFCKKPGDGANRCSENQHRDTKCANFGKMGHAVGDF